MKTRNTHHSLLSANSFFSVSQPPSSMCFRHGTISPVHIQVPPKSFRHSQFSIAFCMSLSVSITRSFHTLLSSALLAEVEMRMFIVITFFTNHFLTTTVRSSISASVKHPLKLHHSLLSISASFRFNRRLAIRLFLFLVLLQPLWLFAQQANARLNLSSSVNRFRSLLLTNLSIPRLR